MAKKESESYGGHNHEFIGEVADRYNCQICTKVIREPHLAVCCGQHFCESCLNKWFTRQGKESCPHCRAEGEGFNHVINKGLRSEINQLKVKCSNHGKGCEWKGELGALKTHLESEKGCGFVIVDCPNRCSVVVLRKELKIHLKSKCSLRSYQCEHCGFKDTFIRITGGILTKSHYDACPSYPLACPNQCGVTRIKRKDMAHHRSKCPQERLECPFAEAGCKNTTRRCKLDDHLTSNQQQHLLLVMGAYKQMKSQLQATEAKLTTAVQLLRQGGEADKEIIDSIITCSPAYLKESGDTISMTMPRVSEYHRIGKAWRSAPFYFNEGYKVCLVVSISQMKAGVCTSVSISICFLKGEYDDKLKWPIGNERPCLHLHSDELVLLPALAASSGIPFTETVHFHICKLQQLAQMYRFLSSPQGSFCIIEDDCLTFTVGYFENYLCESFDVEVSIKCKWI